MPSSLLAGTMPPDKGAVSGDAALVDIATIAPGIIVDMRYATADNFTGRRVYKTNKCILRRVTAERLSSVQKALEAKGLGLKVWDCYRPLSVQKIFWEIVPDQRYVADPRKGSKHNRGSAVDLTLVDKFGRELQMPGAFDDFSPRAHQDYADLPDEVKKNRSLLKDVMQEAGFIPFPDEWWHYDDERWKEFDLMDVPVEKVVVQ